MSIIESPPPIRYLDSGVGPCSKVNHDRYHNRDGAQVTDSEGQVESTTTLAPEVIGQQYSEFLRSLGVPAEDAERHARYLCDPEALAERSENENTTDKVDKPAKNKGLINAQGIIARQVATAKAMMTTIAQATASRSKAELSHIAHDASSRSEVILRRR